MSNKAIIVSDLHKKYDLGSINSGTIKDDISILWSKIRGKEDPTRVIGDEKSGKEYWALKGVDFEITKGESVGIIGKNGAGKSTLLKILSRVTAPTRGNIKVNGRIASLLEVGTGFHPDLSGRENIFMNGAILGMSRHEINIKLDEIIAFSGVEKYIDTPVKRYSSGMYVRLAFAVAAHLESEILIVDEVLAVGDAEFQKKCLGKMNDVSTKDGRTVLFVSHNMVAMSAFCKKGIVLNQGKLDYIGSMDASIQHYSELQKRFAFDNKTSLKDRANRASNKVAFLNTTCHNSDGTINESWTFAANEDVCFEFQCLANDTSNGLTFYMLVTDSMSEQKVTNIKTVVTEKTLEKGAKIDFKLRIPKDILRPGQFDLYFAIGNKTGSEWHDVIDRNINLPILAISPVSIDMHHNMGYFNLPFSINEAIVH